MQYMFCPFLVNFLITVFLDFGLFIIDNAAEAVISPLCLEAAVGVTNSRAAILTVPRYVIYPLVSCSRSYSVRYVIYP